MRGNCCKRVARHSVGFLQNVNCYSVSGLVVLPSGSSSLLRWMILDTTEFSGKLRNLVGKVGYMRRRRGSTDARSEIKKGLLSLNDGSFVRVARIWGK